MPSPRSRGRSRPVPIVAAVATIAAILAACSASTEIDQAEIDQADVAEPVATPEPAPPTSAEIYERVGDSVVFIETPDRSRASGIVIEGGWILTFAHVVDRWPEARIGRADGTDLGDHPVRALDWIFDLALIGPVDDADLAPMARAASAGLAIGDRVLLLGFPDEGSTDPTPTLTEGIVNRRRVTALGKHPYLQVDATIAPGQSGGALIDGEGNLVGISGIEFGQGEFALAFEADAMWPRVDAMLADPGEPLPQPMIGSPVFDEIGLHRTLGLLVETDPDGHLEVIAGSADDIYIELQSLGGVTLTTLADPDDIFTLDGEDVIHYVDDFVDGGEAIVVDIDPGLYQVIVGSFAAAPGEVEVTTPNAFARFADVEEARTLPVGEIVEGELDWARDSDRWQLPLDAGDTVTIVVDGLADTIVAARLEGEPVASDDDAGLGLFGVSPRLEFVAETTGVYEIEIGSLDTDRWGYLVEVSVG